VKNASKHPISVKEAFKWHGKSLEFTGYTKNREFPIGQFNGLLGLIILASQLVVMA